MKYLIGFLVVVIAGCTNSSKIGYMNSTNSNPVTGKMETVEYSPYYEFEHHTDDKTVIARVVITLGPERVPAGYKHTGIFSNDLQRSYRDGIVDWVTEIYFINTSNDPISLTPISLKSGDNKRTFNGELTIQSQSWKITDPIISLESVYGTKSKVEFKFTYNGKQHHVKGVAERMTTAQINDKYAK